MKGWIKLHRSVCDNEIWQSEPFSKGQAWIDLLIVANHKAQIMTVKNGVVVEIKRGECGYSLVALSDRWKWSRGKVSRFLNLLKKQNMIQLKTVENRIIISILNYDIYQDSTLNDTVNSTVNDTVNDTLNDTVNDTVNGHKQECKELKNVNNVKNEKEKKQTKTTAHNQVVFDGLVDEFLNTFDCSDEDKQDLRRAIDSFVLVRKKKRAVLDSTNIETQLKKLKKLREGDNIKYILECLENSIAGAWTGVFDLKEQNHSKLGYQNNKYDPAKDSRHGLTAEDYKNMTI